MEFEISLLRVQVMSSFGVNFQKLKFNNFFGRINCIDEVQYYLFGHRVKTDRLPRP